MNIEILVNTRDFDPPYSCALLTGMGIVSIFLALGSHRSHM